MRTKNKQMANRDLLKEAIADAKAVKETAIANAKAALEEAFTPYLKEKLAAKLSEMDEVDEEADLKEADKSPQDYGAVDKTVDDWSDDHPKGKTGIETYGDDSGEMRKVHNEGEEEDDEMDLDELLRELDALEEEGFGKFSTDGTEGFDNANGDTQSKALDEAEGEEEEYEDVDADGVEDSDDEEVDLESMDEEDLKKFIEGVIADMVASGELEGGEDMESEEGEEEGEEGVDGEMEMGAEMMAEMKKMKKEVEEAKKAKEKAEKELKEALETVSTIKTELQEVNLFNAKLLYTNKIFKAKTLTESQKVKVLAAFDKAASVKEAKLVYETLSSGLTAPAKKPMNESLIKGSASKPAGISEKKPIMEANEQVTRWQKLAGIK